MVVRWFVRLVVVLSVALAGCGTESTGPGPEDGEPGEAVTYFDLQIGSEARYRIFDSQGDSVGTSRLTIIDQFVASGFSGYVALDSIPRWMDTLNYMDTFWIVADADTVFQLNVGDAYSQRQPIVRNRTETDWSWSLYVVGSPSSSGRYTVVFHQRPETETVILTRGGILMNCGRTDLLAIYELSRDTVLLGSEYFAPNIGRVLSSFRPFVQSSVFYRELIR